MCFKVAKDDGVSPFVVMDLFDGSRPNFEIELETEFKEAER
jgi:hypothetical protein